MSRLWSAVLILAVLVSQSYSDESCPKGCICKDHINSVIMRCATLSITDQSNVSVSHFEVVHSSEPLSMKEQIFGNIGLKGVNSITISNSSILNIDKDAFKNLAELTDVKITDTNISYIHPEIFEHNNNLKKLNLGGNPLSEIDSFIKSASIEELNMSNCNLTRIGPNTFENLSQLTLLDLSKNNIKKLVPGTFDKLININEIRLSNNMISDLPKGIFNNKDLQNVFLDNNPIVSFSGETFTNLYTLSLRSCKLQTINENTFGNMEQMMNLDLSNNKIKEIDVNAFSKMPALTTINLSQNNLQYIDENIFANNLNLEKIILDENYLLQLPVFRINNTSLFNVFWFSCENCGLRSLSEKVFRSMPAMVTLKLSNNKISDIRTKVFSHLKALTELDISSNEISTIDDDTFWHNLNLHTLNLAGNPLKSLHPSIFKRNGNLQNLDLSNCGLYELWSSPKTDKLSFIQNLNISHNRISLISVEDLEVTDKLKSLDLSGNDIDCNDSYKTLIQYLTDHEIQDTQFTTHENIALDIEGLSKDMDVWKEKAHKRCPNINFKITKDIDDNKAIEGEFDQEYNVKDNDVESEKEDMDSEDNDDTDEDDDDEEDDDDDDEDEDDEDDKVTINNNKPSNKLIKDAINMLNSKEDNEQLTEGIYLPSRPTNHNFQNLPLLVLIGSALVILGVVVNIFIFIIRRRQQIPIPKILHIRTVSKLKKNSGLVYQQLSEERDGTKTPILGRYMIATVHQPNAPEHV